MKRSICVLLAAMMLLGLCGCGNNNADYERLLKEIEDLKSSSEPTEAPASEPTETPTPAPTDTPTPEPSEEPTEEPSDEPTETPASGIRPEVKDAVDAYETFIDEYVEFMQEYAESNNSISMLTDYLEMLQRYAEEVEKFGDLDTNLTTDESMYYLEVYMRCLEKIAAVGTDD